MYLSLVSFLMSFQALSAFLQTIGSYGNLQHNRIQPSAKMLPSMKLEFRNARKDDIPSIARLCAVAFGASTVTWIPFVASKADEERKQLEKQLYDRYDGFILQGKKHAMVVAIDVAGVSKANENLSSKSIVGFIEVGTLPSPVPLPTNDANGNPIQSILEVPYLGNVAVDRDFRRKGIATKLLRIALKVIEKWGENSLFVAVETDNEQAIKLYEKLDFKMKLDERLSINRSFGKQPRLFMAKMIENGTEKANEINDSF